MSGLRLPRAVRVAIQMDHNHHVGHLGIVTEFDPRRGLRARLMTTESESTLWLPENRQGNGWDWIEDVPIEVWYVEDEEDQYEEAKSYEGRIINCDLERFTVQVTFHGYEDDEADWVSILDDDWKWLDMDRPTEQQLIAAVRLRSTVTQASQPAPPAAKERSHHGKKKAKHAAGHQSHQVQGAIRAPRSEDKPSSVAWSPWMSQMLPPEMALLKRTSTAIKALGQADIARQRDAVLWLRQISKQDVRSLVIMQQLGAILAFHPRQAVRRIIYSNINLEVI